MQERNMQQTMIKQLKSEGFFVRKVSAENSAGLPDLLLIRDGVVYFIEVKTLTGRLSGIQKKVIGDMKAAGAYVDVWFGLDGLYSFLDEVNKCN